MSCKGGQTVEEYIFVELLATYLKLRHCLGILCKLCALHCSDSIESMKQNGYGMAQDLQLITGNWGFELLDIPPVYHGPLHIFQGTEDWMVSPSMQRLVKKNVSVLQI